MSTKFTRIERSIKRALWQNAVRPSNRLKDPACILKCLFIFCNVTTALFSLAALSGVASYYGLYSSNSELKNIEIGLHVCLAWFALNVVLALIFDFRKYFLEAGWLKWLVNILILISAIGFFVPTTGVGVIDFFTGQDFLFISLVSYSLVFLSAKCLALAHKRRMNPSILLAGSFIFVILVGSFLFMLPKSTTVPISYTDAFFIATSAVCVTGLSTLDISQVFTPFGLLILSILIQIGGLGLITFTSVFAIFYSGSASIYNQLLVRDAVYSKSMDALIPTLLYMLLFTVAIESIGAVLIYFSVPDTLFSTTGDKVIFSLFHAMSAFCNAGFSNLKDGLSNPILLYGNQIFYLEISLLMFLGSIGFPILINFKDIVVNRISTKIFKNKIKDRTVRFDLNTRLVLRTSVVLVIVGSVMFFISEYNGTLKDMSFSSQVIQSIFNAILPRTTGFASVNPAEFAPATVLIVCILMWIGGSSQSMAGGIKVNVFAVLLLSLRATITGNKEPSAFNRSIPLSIVQRAYAVAFLATMMVFFFTIVLVYLEPEMSMKAIIFEVMSSLFTVGSSMGITAELSSASKYTLCLAMFLGRVGLLSLLIGAFGSNREIERQYPPENIIIN